MIHELPGKLDLGLAHLGVGDGNLGEWANLVGVEQRLHDDTDPALRVTGHPKHDDVLLATGRIAGHRRAIRLTHHRGEQTVGFFPALLRAEVVRLFIVDGIDALARDELRDLDRLRRFLLQRLQFVRREGDVLILGELVALDHLVARDDLVVDGTDVLLLETRAALAVQQVERNPRDGWVAE